MKFVALLLAMLLVVSASLATPMTKEQVETLFEMLKAAQTQEDQDYEQAYKDGYSFEQADSEQDNDKDNDIDEEVLKKELDKLMENSPKVILQQDEEEDDDENEETVPNSEVVRTQLFRFLGGLVKGYARRRCEHLRRPRVTEQELDEVMEQAIDETVKQLEVENAKAMQEDEDGGVADTQFFKKIGRWFKGLYHRNKHVIRGFGRLAGRYLCNRFFPPRFAEAEQDINEVIVQSLFEKLLD